MTHGDADAGPQRYACNAGRSAGRPDANAAARSNHGQRKPADTGGNAAQRNGSPPRPSRNRNARAGGDDGFVEFVK